MCCVALCCGADGASCFGASANDIAEEKKACAAHCAVEVECGLRSEADCLAAVCDDAGFVVVSGTNISGDDGVDLQTAPVTDCMKSAADCAQAVLCTCPDSCERTAVCLGSDDAECENTCGALVEQAPGDTYLENRCKLESTCDDLPTCGGV